MRRKKTNLIVKMAMLLEKIPQKPLLIISIISIVLGLTLHIYSMTNQLINASVLTINDKTITVQIGKVNSDPIVSKIKKNKHYNYQVGDPVYVNKKGNKIYYHLTPEKNMTINHIGLFLFFTPFILYVTIPLALMIIMSLAVFLIMLPSTLIEQNKLYIIPIICILIGLIIVCTLANGEHANTWLAIGDALILIPFLGVCFLSIKKHKK